jgi:uroporphyrinogen decarboxylase
MSEFMPLNPMNGDLAADLASPSASGGRFVRACLRQPVDRTPVWFLRQAGRYMPEYMAVRKHHSLLEICKRPEIAAEVTITAAEKLDVDAAIIFADLLLPFECMGLPFEFQAGEGPVVHHPVRTLEDVQRLRTDKASELIYVAQAIEKVVAHFKDRLGIIGFCGAPYTLARLKAAAPGSTSRRKSSCTAGPTHGSSCSTNWSRYSRPMPASRSRPGPM